MFFDADHILVVVVKAAGVRPATELTTTVNFISKKKKAISSHKNTQLTSGLSPTKINMVVINIRKKKERGTNYLPKRPSFFCTVINKVPPPFVHI